MVAWPRSCGRTATRPKQPLGRHAAALLLAPQSLTLPAVRVGLPSSSSLRVGALDDDGRGIQSARLAPSARSCSIRAQVRPPGGTLPAQGVVVSVPRKRHLVGEKAPELDICAKARRCVAQVPAANIRQALPIQTRNQIKLTITATFGDMQVSA